MEPKEPARKSETPIFKCPRCELRMLQDNQTKEWVCIYCGYGSDVPLTEQARGHEPGDPETKERLRILNRVEAQFGTDKVDEILKDDPHLRELWHLQLFEDVAREFGTDKVELLVRDRPELKREWDSIAKSVEEGVSTLVDKENKPSGLWYLVPLFFSVLGGIIAYMALRDRDEGMADTCLILGLVLFLVALVVFIVR